MQQFFSTELAPCPYLPGRVERRLVTSLDRPDADQCHEHLTQAGVALVREPKVAVEGTVVDLETGELVRTYPSGQDPEAFDLSHDGRTLYVSNEETAEMSVLDLEGGGDRELRVSAEHVLEHLVDRFVVGLVREDFLEEEAKCIVVAAKLDAAQSRSAELALMFGPGDSVKGAIGYRPNEGSRPMG